MFGPLLGQKFWVTVSMATSDKFYIILQYHEKEAKFAGLLVFFLFMFL